MYFNHISAIHPASYKIDVFYLMKVVGETFEESAIQQQIENTFVTTILREKIMNFALKRCKNFLNIFRA